MKKTLAQHRHCGRGPAIQAVDKDKNLLNREPGSMSGMTFTAKAFTLIELLVVVLIIGILAAVALPQYQKAVKKSHVAKILPVLRSIYNAERVFRLERTTRSTNVNDLSIQIPALSLPGYPSSRYEFESCSDPNDCDKDHMYYLLEFATADEEEYLYIGVQAAANEEPVFFCNAWPDKNICKDYGFNTPYTITSGDWVGSMPSPDVYKI